MFSKHLTQGRSVFDQVTNRYHGQHCIRLLIFLLLIFFFFFPLGWYSHFEDGPKYWSLALFLSAVKYFSCQSIVSFHLLLRTCKCRKKIKFDVNRFVYEKCAWKVFSEQKTIERLFLLNEILKKSVHKDRAEIERMF